MSVDTQNFHRVVKEQQGGINPQMWPIRISPAELGIGLNSPVEININPCDLLWMPSTYDKSYGVNPFQSSIGAVYSQCIDPILAGQNVGDVFDYNDATSVPWGQEAALFALRFNSPNNPWILWGLSTLLYKKRFGGPQIPSTAPVAQAGLAMLVNGTVTVLNSQTPSRNTGGFQLTCSQVVGEQGLLSIGAVTAGVSFQINSDNPLDDSVISWTFIAPPATTAAAKAQAKKRSSKSEPSEADSGPFGTLTTPFGQSGCMRSITGPITRLWVQYYRWATVNGNVPYPPPPPSIPASQVVLMSMLGYGHETVETVQPHQDNNYALGGVIPSPKQFSIAGNTYLTPQLNTADLNDLGRKGDGAK
jgi:hypothetical protein